MSAMKPVKRILLVTGLSGAGKTTALQTLEDIGWEAVDNFPIRLAGSLLAMPSPEGKTEIDIPLALGFDTRTRGFEANRLIEQIKNLQKRDDLEITMLFLDCAGTEIERRYSETRRRHPLAQDRPAMDGIAQERALMEPLRRWADSVIDTTRLSSSELQAKLRDDFRTSAGKMTVSIMSFGFSRGVPHNADMIFDMRFLRNPHWDADLRPKTGLDQDVADYIEEDESYEESISKISDLLSLLLPRYDAQGKAYATIAFGCTGGRHRSVHVAEHFGQILRKKGYSPSIDHRNLNSRPIDALEWQGNRGDTASRN